MKKIFTVFIILIIAGYFSGNYFVNYALLRNNSNPPPAVDSIADKNITVPTMPDFYNDTWTITSADNLKLYATYFAPKIASHRWAILVHGYGRDQRFAYDFAEEYLKHGYNVLTVDLRASGKSEGDYITMGYFESRDIVLWSEKVLEYDSQAKIVFHGVSMGAATVLMAAAMNPKNLCAVIEDCGYTSAYKMFTMQLKEIFGLPEFPIMPVADIVCKIKTGVKISDASPIETVAKISVPVFFIHGDSDRLVPCDMMTELFDNTVSYKESWIVENAGHAMAKFKNPQVYFERVFEFADNYTN